MSRTRCPWCPTPGGCHDCSLSGEPPANHVLISEAEHQRRARPLRALIAVLGVLIVVLVALATVGFAT